jgi:hypothetical protein
MPWSLSCASCSFFKHSSIYQPSEFVRKRKYEGAYFMDFFFFFFGIVATSICVLHTVLCVECLGKSSCLSEPLKVKPYIFRVIIKLLNLTCSEFSY